MKTAYFLLLSTLIYVFFTSSSSGAALAQMRDRTGSPLATGTCSNCHIGGDFGTQIALQLLQDTTSVAAYVPGETYQLQVSIQATIRPERYGFQAVALTGDSQLNAGTFGPAPANTQVTLLNDRSYFEHDRKLTDSTYTIDWTAPLAGTGEVRFYAAGNAVNNSNDPSGDDVSILDEPLRITENSVNSIFDQTGLDFSWTTFPNPTADILYLNLSAKSKKTYRIRLVDQQNRLLQSAIFPVFPGENSWQVSLADLPSGLYFLQLMNQEGVFSKKIIKRSF